MTQKTPNRRIKEFKSRIPFSSRQLIIFALIFAAIGSYVLYRSFAASPAGTAHVFVSPSGSDSGTNCKRYATPVAYPGGAVCASITKAYQLAQGGDTIDVQGGTYSGYETLANDASKNSTPITIRGAQGSTVTHNNGIAFGNDQTNTNSADNVVLQDMTFKGTITLWSTADNVQLVNLKADIFDIFGGNGSGVKGGDYGPCQAPAQGSCLARIIGNNITVDGTAIHHMSSTDLVNYHVDGMFVRGCTNCTVKNTDFWGNMITNIRVQNCCQLPANTNLTLENNWFGVPIEGDNVTGRGNALDIDNDVPGLRIKYNTFHPQTGISICGAWACNPADGGWTATDTQIIGNLFSRAFCASGAVYRNNVYRAFSEYAGSESCGTGEKLVTDFGLVNSGPYSNTPSSPDFHLTSSSPAIGAGDPTNYTATDYDGQPRPQGTAPDAGADEYSTGTTPPPPPPTAPTVSLSSSPTSVASGSASTLTWSSTNATSCTASGSWSGAKATSGSQSTGNLTSSSTYSLACTGTGGSASASTTVTVSGTSADTTPPSIPTGLGHTTTTDSSLSLVWNASSDNVGVKGYKLYRNNALITSPTSTSYVDSGLSAGTSYSYAVSAFDAAGNESAKSATVSFTTATSTSILPLPPPNDTVAPSTPDGFKVTSSGKTSVSLAWNASTDIGGSGLAGYKLYRGSTLVYTGPNLSFNSTGLSSKSSYTYTVHSYDKAGNMSNSSIKICVSKFGFWSNITRSRGWEYC
ncbi:hypothetical protein H0X09_00910 [Candidatus Saccharibacteria bacterium]|nr:hypothetical protein [Candidatus Saccharibacteria bacterium]